MPSISPTIATAVILLTAFLGAFLQSSIGFGCAVIMMNIITFVFPTGKAIVITQCGCILLALSILRKHHDKVRFDVVVPIMIPSVVCTIIATTLSIGANFTAMKLMLGILFVLISIFFSVFSSRIHVRPSKGAGITLGVVSGTCNGLFSVGGPPAVLYLAPALDDKEEYIASTQVFFLSTNLVSLTIRFFNREASVSDIKFILVCFVGIILGSLVGTKVSGKLNAGIIRKLVYIFVGANGILIILTSGIFNDHDISISLNENPTTGYRWEVSVEPDDVLEIVGDEYVTSNPAKGFVGAPGTRTFRFSILRKQQATVTFRLRRSWENGPAAETRTYLFLPDSKSLTLI